MLISQAWLHVSHIHISHRAMADVTYIRIMLTFRFCSNTKDTPKKFVGKMKLNNVLGVSIWPCG